MIIFFYLLSFPSLLDFLKILLKSFSRASESRLKLYFELNGMNHTHNYSDEILVV